MPPAPTKDSPPFTAAAKEALPVPPRYWWLKRLSLGFACLILALLALRLGWGWYADRLLQAEIDRIVAADEPIYPEDFDPTEPVADEDNAVKALVDAASSLSLSPEELQFLVDHVDDPDTIRSRHDLLQTMIAKNRDALTLSRKAANLPDVDWGLRFRSPAVNTILPWFSGQRQLTRYIATVAIYFAQADRHDEAVETLEALIVQGDVIMMQPTLIANLVGIAIIPFGARGVEHVAPTLVVADGEVDSRAAGPARRDRVERLIGLLLNVDTPQIALRGAMLGERMLILDQFRGVLEGWTSLRALPFGGVGGTPSWLERVVSWPLTPAYRLQARRAVMTMRTVIDVTEAPAFIPATIILPDVRLDQVTTPLERIILPPVDLFHRYDRCLVFNFRTIAHRRMAGLALAIRLYELDHGRRPEHLEQLIPDYVPAIPIDPFGDGERLIAYAPNATPPVLYSIGEDGVDDGGRFEVGSHGEVRVDFLDIVFFLDGKRPRAKPSELPSPSDSDSETVEENADIDDDGGEEDETEAQQQEPH